jgi:alkanesulfonate monooxygenase SsuD/methylene tetrahydromethanopterin reductase-like flavin-dependent oxidoreductase (luciferase family)
VKLALCLEGLPVGDLRPIAAEAERRGFRKVLAAETTGADPFVACAAMAAATRSILVGTGIAGIHGRSAASTAMAAASLATLSGAGSFWGSGSSRGKSSRDSTERPTAASRPCERRYTSSGVCSQGKP